jgi:hypothetical protein
VQDNPNLFELVFAELASDNVENVEIASKAICELLNLSRNITEFKAIKEYICANTDKLLQTCAVAI